MLKGTCMELWSGFQNPPLFWLPWQRRCAKRYTVHPEMQIKRPGSAKNRKFLYLFMFGQLLLKFNNISAAVIPENVFWEGRGTFSKLLRTSVIGPQLTSSKDKRKYSIGRYSTCQSSRDSGCLLYQGLASRNDVCHHRES